jgi:hypothetical protein
MWVTHVRARLVLPLLALAFAIVSPGFSQNQPLPSNSTEQRSNPALLREAAKAISAGDLPLAEVELRTILETSPRDYRALNFMGIVRAQQKPKRRQKDSSNKSSRLGRILPEVTPPSGCCT